jgi:hypothetical protein
MNEGSCRGGVPGVEGTAEDGLLAEEEVEEEEECGGAGGEGGSDGRGSLIGRRQWRGRSDSARWRQRGGAEGEGSAGKRPGSSLAAQQELEQAPLASGLPAQQAQQAAAPSPLKKRNSGPSAAKLGAAPSAAAASVAAASGSAAAAPPSPAAVQQQLLSRSESSAAASPRSHSRGQASVAPGGRGQHMAAGNEAAGRGATTPIQ